MNWRTYFNRYRTTRALVRHAGVARPRIKILTAQLMQPHREPGLLAATTTPENVRATVVAITALEAKLEYDTSAVSPRAQRIAPDDLATIKDTLK